MSWDWRDDRIQYLERMLAATVETLEWYANVLHANGSSGDRAREILAEIKGKLETSSYRQREGDGGGIYFGRCCK